MKISWYYHVFGLVLLVNTLEHDYALKNTKNTMVDPYKIVHGICFFFFFFFFVVVTYFIVPETHRMLYDLVLAVPLK